MKRLHTIEATVLAFVLLVASGSAGCVVTAESSGHQSITAELEPLRSAFNAEPDHVRAILLASPT